MEALSSYSVGVWSVQTVTGTTYLLDLDNMLVVHQSDLSADNDNILRRDGDPISLVRLHHCEVGDPMVLSLDLHAPEVDFTIRDFVNGASYRIDRCPVRGAAVNDHGRRG